MTSLRLLRIAFRHRRRAFRDDLILPGNQASRPRDVTVASCST